MTELKNKKVYLAPLAGVSDQAFRLICQGLGADKTFTEMVSAAGLKYNSKKTYDLTLVGPGEKNVAFQLFGSDPEVLDQVIRKYLNPRDEFCEINFNMGCPAPKITKNGDGSALLKDPKKVEKILKTLVKASDKPVSLKFRLGFEDRNYLTIGKIAQDAGISYLILHGRTAKEFYTGHADRKAIKNLKNELQIPVIANGDIFSVEDFVKAMEETGADGAMLARGAMENPFLFKEIKDYMISGSYKKASPDELIDCLEDQYRLEMEFKDPAIVIKQMRKVVGRYTKGLKRSSKLREKVNKLDKREEILNLLEDYRESLREEEND